MAKQHLQPVFLKCSITTRGMKNHKKPWETTRKHDKSILKQQCQRWFTSRSVTSQYICQPISRNQTKPISRHQTKPINSYTAQNQTVLTSKKCRLLINLTFPRHFCCFVSSWNFLQINMLLLLLLLPIHLIVMNYIFIIIFFLLVTFVNILLLPIFLKHLLLYNWPPSRVKLMLNWLFCFCPSSASHAAICPPIINIFSALLATDGGECTLQIIVFHYTHTPSPSKYHQSWRCR